MSLSKQKLEQTPLLVERLTADITVLRIEDEIFLISAASLKSDFPKESNLLRKTENYPTRSKPWGKAVCEFWILALEHNDIEKQFEVVETIAAKIKAQGYHDSRWENLIWIIRTSHYVFYTLLNHPLIEIWLDKIK